MLRAWYLVAVLSAEIGDDATAGLALDALEGRRAALPDGLRRLTSGKPFSFGSARDACAFPRTSTTSPRLNRLRS